MLQDNVRDIFMKAAPKAYEMDPIPSLLLMSCVDELCLFNTSITNKSLSSAYISSVFIQTTVRKPHKHFKSDRGMLVLPIFVNAFDTEDQGML